MRERSLNENLDLELPLAELSAARLDGEVLRRGPAFSPIDMPDTVRARARALGVAMPRRLIADRRTAAWVFGAIDSLPPRIDSCARADARPSVLLPFLGAVREVVIDDDEFLDFDGVLVTTPLRTVFDLVREPAFTDGTAQLARAVAETCGVSREECEQYLRQRAHLPKKSQTRSRLAVVFDQRSDAA